MREKKTEENVAIKLHIYRNRHEPPASEIAREQVVDSPKGDR